MFVRFSCGCVGLHLVGPDGTPQNYVIQFCDADWSDLGFVRRDMAAKTHEPLSASDTERLGEKIHTYLGWGHEFESMARTFVRVGGGR